MATESYTPAGEVYDPETRAHRKDGIQIEAQRYHPNEIIVIDGEKQVINFNDSENSLTLHGSLVAVRATFSLPVFSRDGSQWGAGVDAMTANEYSQSDHGLQYSSGVILNGQLVYSEKNKSFNKMVLAPNGESWVAIFTTTYQSKLSIVVDGQWVGDYNYEVGSEVNLGTTANGKTWFAQILQPGSKVKLVVNGRDLGTYKLPASPSSGIQLSPNRQHWAALYTDIKTGYSIILSAAQHETYSGLNLKGISITNAGKIVSIVHKSTDHSDELLIDGASLPLGLRVKKYELLEAEGLVLRGYKKGPEHNEWQVLGVKLDTKKTTLLQAGEDADYSVAPDGTIRISN